VIEIILKGITPAPQGSKRAINVRGFAQLVDGSSDVGKKKTRVFRNALAAEAKRVIESSGKGMPYFGKHVPVVLEATFCFKRPKSCPKSRQFPVVKPDRDKLLRAAQDALSGILYHDDAQVVGGDPRKLYADFEGVIIHATTLDEGN
jgi:Holliday junction resolvase RusA-like endonuclease